MGGGGVRGGLTLGGGGDEGWGVGELRLGGWRDESWGDGGLRWGDYGWEIKVGEGIKVGGRGRLKLGRED